MLADYRSATMIPAKDLTGTRRWYEQVLGLRAETADSTSVVFRSAESQLNLYQTEAAGTAEHTLIGWSVDDIEAVVDGLTAKGVSFERYDMPGLQTNAKGIAQIGQERGAGSRIPKATS